MALKTTVVKTCVHACSYLYLRDRMANEPSKTLGAPFVVRFRWLILKHFSILKVRRCVLIHELSLGDGKGSLFGLRTNFQYLKNDETKLKNTNNC